MPKPLKEIGLYPLEELEIDDEVSQSVICWNAAKLYQTQPECFRYMRSTYPHTWNKIEYIVDKFKSKPTDYQKQVEKRIDLIIILQGPDTDACQRCDLFHCFHGTTPVFDT